MKKRFLSIVLMAVLAMAFCLSACKTEVTVETDVADIEQAVADYIVAEKGKNYDKADACIPEVYLIGTEVHSDDTVTVYGDYFIDNFNIKDDTLENVSGGDYAGVMHLVKDGNTYKVVKFEEVEDGEGYTASAKKLFGSYYDAFAQYQSDDAAKKRVRTKAIAKYVKDNGLKVTQYQDYGWDPVPLETK